MAARYTRLPSFRGGIELHTAASRVTASHTIFTGPDEDNDSIYLTNGDLTVSNTEIGYNKDDGIDSGGNGGQDPYTAEDDIAPLVCVVKLIGLPGISGLI